MFKKQYIIAAALSGALSASAATDLIYWGGNGNHDLLTINGSSTPYLGNAETINRADSSVVESLTTEGNTDYNLIFSPTNDDDIFNPIFTLNQAIYLNYMTIGNANTGDQPSSYTINLGSSGAIYASGQQSEWGGGINFGESVKKEGGSVNFGVSLSTDQLATLTSTGIFTRDLLVSVDIGTKDTASGFWNLSDAKTITISGIAGYTSVGYVDSADKIAEGQYGLVINEHDNGYSKATLVVKLVPEPATATLGLLALAGLAARRRRK